MYLPFTYGSSPDICVHIDASNLGEEDKKVYYEVQIGPPDDHGKLCPVQKHGAVLPPKSRQQKSSEPCKMEFVLPVEQRPWANWRLQLKVWTSDCSCLPCGLRRNGSFVGGTKPMAMPYRTQTTSVWLDNKCASDFTVTWSAQRKMASGDILSAAKALSRDMVHASAKWDDKQMAKFFVFLRHDEWDGCGEKCLDLIVHAYKPTSLLYEAVRRKNRAAIRCLVKAGAPMHQLHVEECSRFSSPNPKPYPGTYPKSPYTLAKELGCVDLLMEDDILETRTNKQLIASNMWDVLLYRLKQGTPEASVSRAVFEFAWKMRWPVVAHEVVNNAANGAFATSDAVVHCITEGGKWAEVGHALVENGAISTEIIKTVFNSPTRASHKTIEVVVDGLRKTEIFPKVLLFQRCSECLICFEPTFANIPSYFTDEKGLRTCVHYFCRKCAVMVVSNRECPSCRVPILGVVSVPSIKEEPENWFRTVDAHNNGHLTKLEVLSALEACLPLDKEKLADALGELWANWTGTQHVITSDDFFKPDGLFQFVLLHEDQMMRDLEIGCFGEECDLPPMTSSAKWFDFWSHGVPLSEFELLRGLLKTLRISSIERAKMYEVQRKLREVCQLDARIDKEEFIQPGGLGERLLDQFFPDANSSPKSYLTCGTCDTSDVLTMREKDGDLTTPETRYPIQHPAGLAFNCTV